MPHMAQTYVCTVCNRRAYGCRRLEGLREVQESTTIQGPEERVCGLCWIILKEEFEVVPLPASGS